MKIRHETVNVEMIELTRKQSHEIAVDYLQSMLGYGNFVMVNSETGKLEVWANIEAYHGSDWTEYRRDATSQDLAIWSVLKYLREIKDKYGSR
jgi:hypothetical protein